MNLLSRLEEWGRGRVLAVLAQGMPTPEMNAQEFGQALSQNPAPKILLIGLYQKMGQFLCATPLIRTFAHAWPRAALHFLGNPANAPAARANPRLRRVWVWNKSAVWEWPAQRKALRAEQFDLALLLTTDRPSATGVFLARQCNARAVAAFQSSIPGQWGKDATGLAHIRIPRGSETNEVEKYLELARAFGLQPQDRKPEFLPAPQDESAVQTFLSTQTLAWQAPRVGVFLGGKAERSDRLWPVTHFARLADAINKAGFQVFAISPPPPEKTVRNTFLSDEHLRVAEFQKQLSWSCPVFQDASLGRVAAFLKRLDLLICPDGGILHLAAAVGTPTLGLFFSTDPEVWRHEGQIVVDGRNKPSVALEPETVMKDVFRFMGVAGQA